MDARRTLNAKWERLLILLGLLRTRLIFGPTLFQGRFDEANPVQTLLRPGFAKENLSYIYHIYVLTVA